MCGNSFCRKRIEAKAIAKKCEEHDGAQQTGSSFRATWDVVRFLPDEVGAGAFFAEGMVEAMGDDHLEAARKRDGDLDPVTGKPIARKGGEEDAGQTGAY